MGGKYDDEKQGERKKNGSEPWPNQNETKNTVPDIGKLEKNRKKGKKRRSKPKTEGKRRKYTYEVNCK